MMREHFERRSPLKDPLAGHEPVGDASERVDVGARVDRPVAARLFRRQVARRAANRAFDGEIQLGRVTRSDRLDQAEVEHLDEVHFPSVTADVDVRRLDVAVHEPGLMSLGQRRARLVEPSQRHATPAPGPKRRTNSSASTPSSSSIT